MLWALPAMGDVKAGVDAWSMGEYRKAVEIWRGDATRGDADAEFNLGQAYRMGRGVPVDLKVAEGWYRKAALQGHVEAETNYGLTLFDEGQRADALPWLEKSVSRGEPRAQLALGTMLYNGDGVARDFPRAYALIVRSSASGLPRATDVQQQMDQYVPLPDRQKGLELAKQYEAEARRPPLPEIAARQVGEQSPVVAPPPAQAHTPIDPRPPKPEREVAAAAPPPPPPVPVRAAPPRPVAASPSGGWRLQLGAFGDAANAHRLWSEVGGRFAGRQASFVRAGALTKLIVGPYASRGAAAAACGNVSPCVPVAP